MSAKSMLCVNTTSFFKTSDKYSATGFKLSSGSKPPFFGRPKCAMSITAAPSPSSLFIVGKASIILVSSVIFLFSSTGTLKSTLTRTFFPAKFTSFIPFMSVSFFELFNKSNTYFRHRVRFERKYIRLPKIKRRFTKIKRRSVGIKRRFISAKRRFIFVRVRVMIFRWLQN